MLVRDEGMGGALSRRGTNWSRRINGKLLSVGMPASFMPTCHKLKVDCEERHQVQKKPPYDLPVDKSAVHFLT